MRVLVLVTLLGSVVCSGELASSPGLEHRTAENDSDEDGASLAIVFDTTGSMHPERAQVKRKAAEILQAALTRPGWPIKDFILAPFNDPIVPNATITTDPNIFQQQLEDIVVKDGTDCEEKALTGLLNALKLIRPRDEPEEGANRDPGKSVGTGGRFRSTVVVFTDATPKDHRLLQQVLKIVQRKQPVVFFVLSGVCEKSENIKKEAFSKIASISLGHIFQLEKTDVGMVMDILDKSLQHKVNLLSVDKATASKDQHEVIVDPTIQEILVVISGSDPEITVTDPSGQLVDVKPLVSLETVKVIALKEPDPGSWKINTSSSSPHTVRFTGISTIDFVYGFSAKQTDFINETYHRPLKGADNFILVASSGMGAVWNLTNIELTALNGLSTHKMQLDPVGNGFYRTGQFVPPDDAFYLTSYGFGTDGYPLKRITPTAILPETPALPQIYLQERQTAPIGRQITLYCQIESLIPITAWWTKETRLVSKRESHKQTATVILTLDVHSENVAGEYKCYASNAQGVSVKAVTVFATGPPPEVFCPAEGKTTPNGRLTLECTVVSTLRHNISWSTQDGRALDNNTRYTILPNGTLIIDPVWEDDSDLYNFTASNAAGTSTGSIQVDIFAPTSVQIEPTTLKFQKGQSFNLSCVASGGPALRVWWQRGGSTLDDDTTGRFKVTSDGTASFLQVSGATPEDEGIYKCVAQHITQKMPLVESSAECRYVEQPQVALSETNPLVKLGDSLTVTCSASGIPTPEVTWSKLEEGQKVPLLNYIKYEVRDSVISIHGVRQEDDGAKVMCEARNEVGMAEALLRLQVGRPPYIVDSSPYKHVALEISQSGMLTCDIDAIPKPTVTWMRNESLLLDKSRFRVDQYSENLNITDVQVEDGGTYECIAENIFGKTKQQTEVTISGLEVPVIQTEEQQDTPRKVVVGTNISINCVTSGIPKPSVAWYHNEVILAEFEGHYKKAPNESLLIEEVKSVDSGPYRCESTNAVGKTSATFILQVITPPVIIGDTISSIDVEEGQTAFLACEENSPSHQRGNFTWTHNDQALQLTASYSLSDGGLSINDVKRELGGLYVCSVTNEAGTANKSVTLTVLIPPEIAEKDDTLNVVAGVNVFLPCMVSGIPAPNVSWTRDNSPVNMTDERYATESGLVLLGVAVNDSGEYACVAENSVGSATSTTQLSVSVPAWIERSNVSDISVLKGESMFLPCKPNGTPFPEVGWTFHGLPLNFTNNERFKSTEESMEINAAQESDSGVYTCSVANAAGSDSQSITLTVNGLLKSVPASMGAQSLAADGVVFVVAAGLW